MDPITTICTGIIVGLSVKGIEWLVSLLVSKYGKYNAPKGLDLGAAESKGFSKLSPEEQVTTSVLMLWAQREYLLAEGYSEDEVLDMIIDMLNNPEKYIEAAKTQPSSLQQMSFIWRFLDSLNFRNDDE